MGLAMGVTFGAKAQTEATSKTQQERDLKDLKEMAELACAPGKFFDTCFDWTKPPSKLAKSAKAYQATAPCESLGFELLRNCSSKTKEPKMRDLVMCSLKDGPRRFGLKLSEASVCQAKELSQIEETL